MGRWVRVVAADEIPQGQGKPVQVDGRWFALFRDGDEFHATDDACPHQGASLGEGTLHAGQVICPWHGWVFHLRSGACRGIPGLSVTIYPVRRRGDDLEIELPEEDLPEGDAA